MNDPKAPLPLGHYIKTPHTWELEKIKADETTDWHGLKQQNEQPDPWTFADFVCAVILVGFLAYVVFLGG